MTRSQRRRHLWMWLVLGPLGLAVIVAGLVVRHPPRRGAGHVSEIGQVRGEWVPTGAGVEPSHSQSRKFRRLSRTISPSPVRSSVREDNDGRDLP